MFTFELFLTPEIKIPTIKVPRKVFITRSF